MTLAKRLPRQPTINSMKSSNGLPTTTTARTLRAIVLFIGLVFSSAAFAQGVVSSGLTGNVRDSAGKPVAGATITATHTPTGTAYNATTTDTGRYNFRGLIAGGPYTVSIIASGFKPLERPDLMTQLGQDAKVDFSLENSSVVVMEKFTVSGLAGELNANATGAGSLLDTLRLATKPTTQRSLADLVSASSFVTLTSLSSANDREEAHIVAVGQNNRYNSVLIDGSPINDQFGLNGTGLASFFNPLSIDIIDQLSIEVSPYDTRLSGFTGAAVNAVTKSGTNTFHGSLYYDLSKDKLLGFRGQGPDVAVGPTQGIVPILKRDTQGFTFGGPILKNKLFFFLNYEKFIRIAPALTSGLNPDAADLTLINARIAAINTAAGKGTDFGTYTQNIVNQAQEKKKLAKIDWNIVPGQRLSVRYSETPGTVPLFGDFGLGSFGGGIVTNSGGGTSAFSSAFYSQIRKEKNITATLTSQWTQNFKTELRWGIVKQDQYTPINATLPQVRIFGINGTNNAGVRISNGVLEMGTDQFRMGNQINAKTKTYSAVGDYFMGNITFSGGVQYEKNDDYNLFRAGSYGIFDYANIAAFQADTANGFSRGYYVQGTPEADISDSSITGVFGQAKWEVLPRLNVMAGLREDFVASGTRPPFNQLFKDRFGIANNGTIDGVTVTSPRISANWSVDEGRTTQIRGGVGHFLGRAPWVFFSNSYSAPGIGRYTDVQTTGSLVTYLKTTFDPANPIGVSPSIPATGRFEVDLTDDKIQLPSVWRGNLAVDRKLSLWNSTLSLEVIQTYNDKALFISNDNLLPTTRGADGRQRFAGNPATVANARFAEFLNVYHVKNIRTGESRYLTLNWDRPMKNNWAANFTYTRGRSTEASSMGQTTASGMWQRNSVFNQNAVEEAHSDYEVPNRVQTSYTREFVFMKDWKTSATLYYEGHTGNPFSYVYSTDLNGDSQSNNDLIAVPTSASDARFDFSLMSAADQAAYFAYLQSTGLSKFAGGVAPKNAFYQPWVSRLDLHLAQTIPIYKPAELEVFLDFINLGAFLDNHLFNYFEKAPLNSNDVFWRVAAGGASYGPDGRIRPTFNSAAANANSTMILDNVQSRWRIQAGAKLKF
jgi:hypothetical protein